MRIRYRLTRKWLARFNPGRDGLPLATSLALLAIPLGQISTAQDSATANSQRRNLDVVDAIAFRQMIESSPAEGLSARPEMVQAPIAVTDANSGRPSDWHQAPQTAAAQPYAGSASPQHGYDQAPSRSIMEGEAGYPVYPTEPYDSRAGCDSPGYYYAAPSPTSPTYSTRPSRLPRVAVPAQPIGVPCGQCGGPASNCGCGRPRRQVHHVVIEQPTDCDDQRQPATSAPEPAAASVPPGSFVAPPQQGPVVGQSQSLGIRGMRLTFPEISLAFPSIELPSFVRRFRRPSMELQAGQAAYVADRQQPSNSFATLAAFQANRMSAQTNRQPATTPTSDAATAAASAAADEEKVDQAEKDFDALQQRCGRLESLLEQLIAAQQTTIQALPTAVETLPAPHPVAQPPAIHPHHSQPATLPQYPIQSHPVQQPVTGSTPPQYWPAPVNQIPCDHLPGQPIHHQRTRAH